MVTFKQKCSRCRKNYVVVSRRTRFAVCYECQKEELKGEITDPEMKKLFDIDESFYKDNNFLRSIKANYLRYGNLTERQIEAFKKSVDKMKQTDTEEKNEA